MYNNSWVKTVGKPDPDHNVCMEKNTIKCGYKKVEYKSKSAKKY